MLDLKTCHRSELVPAYKALKRDNKELKARLAEYEPPETEDKQEEEFQRFWKMYERKGNLKTSRKRFSKLSDKKKALIFNKLPAYVKSTFKDARYPSRKFAEVWLSKEGWNDEIVDKKDYQNFNKPVVGRQSFNVYKKPVRTESTVNISNRISEMK